ncbi:MAG: phosphate-starvation-inducible PsiE family protein [Cyanobium sp. ELA507]
MRPSSEHRFQALISQFERTLSMLLAVLLVVVLAATTVQLVMATAVGLVQPQQDWLDGGLLTLLDRLLLLLIGLEVLQNLTAYLRDHSIQTELVVLTALTAVARKLIVMPPGHEKDPVSLIGVGVVILCLAVAYQILHSRKTPR